jgi:hypothetical protein
VERRVFYLIFLSVMSVLWLVWVGLSWWALLREKRRPLELTGVPDGDPRTKNDYVMVMGRQAEKEGFRRIGTFVDSDPKWRQGVFSMLLRPDGLTLLRIHHSALIKKVVLISALTSDVWVVTVSANGDPDSSGLSEEELVYTSKDLARALARHAERIAGREEEIIPWSPEEIAQDLMARDRKKIEMLVADGRARVHDETTGAWLYTFAGAKVQRALIQKFFKEMIEQGKRKEKKK